MKTAEELRKDIEELQLLLQRATRQRATNILTVELKKAETELSDLLQNAVSGPGSSKDSGARTYTVKLRNYAWDQSDKFVKVYVSGLSGASDLPPENVTCAFEKRSVTLTVKELHGKNYSLPLLKLLEEIEPSKSHWKVKPDGVTIFLAKKNASRWQHLLASELKPDAFSSMPSHDPDEDPSASLMKLMKKMYDEGDDEMKRTLTKSWFEAQNKRSDAFPEL